MMRALAVLLALVAAGAASVGLAWVFRSDRMIADERGAAGALEEERALAIAAGLALVEEGATTETEITRTVPVPAQECVALVAVSYGLRELEVARLSLAGRGARDVAAGYERTLVHHAICAATATTASIEIRSRLELPDWPEARGGIRFAILRGAVREPTRYGRLSRERGRAAPAEERAVLARLEDLNVSVSRVGGLARAPVEAAIVLPETRAAFGAARALTGAPDLAPAFVSGADPLAAPDDRAIPARVHTSRGVARLIAAVDAGALGSPCVAVWIARLDDRPLEVRRVEIPALTELALEEGDALARDVICPATGLFLYVTDVSVTAPFAIVAYASAASEGVTATPSSWEPTPLPLPDLAAARAACDAGEATGCARLAGLAAAGVGGAGDPHALLERACASAGGEPCDRLATLEGAGGDASERRACATGFVPACLRRARRFLDGARDLAAAHQAFERACQLRDLEACGAASAMVEWQLVPSGA